MSSSEALTILDAHAVAVTRHSGYVLVAANMSDIFKLLYMSRSLSSNKGEVSSPSKISGSEGVVPRFTPNFVIIGSAWEASSHTNALWDIATDLSSGLCTTLIPRCIKSNPFSEVNPSAPNALRYILSISSSISSFENVNKVSSTVIDP
jgi:hypothetical protein